MSNETAKVGAKVVAPGAAPVSGNAVVEPKSSGPASPLGSDAINLKLSDAQFERLEKAIIFGAIASGVVFGRPGLTASPANLKQIKDLGNAVVELL